MPFDLHMAPARRFRPTVRFGLLAFLKLNWCPALPPWAALFLALVWFDHRLPERPQQVFAVRRCLLRSGCSCFELFGRRLSRHLNPNCVPMVANDLDRPHTVGAIGNFPSLCEAAHKAVHVAFGATKGLRDLAICWRFVVLEDVFLNETQDALLLPGYALYHCLKPLPLYTLPLATMAVTQQVGVQS